MNFTGDIKELQEGINLILNEENLNADVEVQKGDCLKISEKDGKYKIGFSAKSEFFRGLTILADKIKKGEKDFEVVQKKQFNSCGIMIDVSRRAVLKPETVKIIIRYMAKMGLNMMMLYTEDTFKMDKYPYFGYLRGAYTKDEIKELVAYGEKFGIELVPCIQTLAHLATTLRWGYADGMKDTGDILLIDEEKTYEFIEEMIKTSRECYKTDKIHIGMDEAGDVGFGEYFRRHGYVNRFELLSRHLKRVMEITDKYGFKPMMWSDMFFRLASKNGSYYDTSAKMPENISELIPENISMVYWDYYNTDEKVYDFMIKTHQEMKRNVVFAGGIWTWIGLSPQYDKTFITTKLGLSSCRKNGIKDVFATMWGDDGAECSIFAALLGLQLYGEYNYFDEVSDEHLAEMFKICTGYDMDAFSVFNIDDFGELCKDHDAAVSKQVFYSDVLLGLFDKNLAKLDLKKHYKEIADKFDTIKKQPGLEYLFDYQKQLVSILYKKCTMGIDVTEAYRKGDKVKLGELAKEIREIANDTEIIRKMQYEIWNRNNKAFGFEFFDSKFGGRIARLLTAAQRIEDYIEGKIDKIEELDEEKLYYSGNENPFIHQYCAGMIQMT